jgi:hypothetical protein
MGKKQRHGALVARLEAANLAAAGGNELMSTTVHFFDNHVGLMRQGEASVACCAWGLQTD